MHCQCSSRLSSSRLCRVHAIYHFRKEKCVKKQLKLKKKKKKIFGTTLLYLASVYMWRGPIDIATVAVMPWGRLCTVIRIKTIHYAYNNTRLTHLSGQ